MNSMNFVGVHSLSATPLKNDRRNLIQSGDSIKNEDHGENPYVLTSLTRSATEANIARLPDTRRNFAIFDDSINASKGSLDEILSSKAMSSRPVKNHSEKWNQTSKKSSVFDRHKKWFESHATGKCTHGVNLYPSERNLLARKPSGITDFKAERERFLTRRADFVQNKMRDEELQSVEIAKKAAEQQQANSELRAALASMNYESLPALANRVLALNSDDSLAWTCLGLSLEVGGQEDALVDGGDFGFDKYLAAIEAYKKAIKAAPDASRGARANLAHVQMRLGQSEDSISTLRSALEKDKDGSFGIANDLVVALKENGKQNEAKSVWLSQRGSKGFSKDPRLSCRSVDLIQWGATMEDQALYLRQRLRGFGDEKINTDDCSTNDNSVNSNSWNESNDTKISSSCQFLDEPRDIKGRPKVARGGDSQLILLPGGTHAVRDFYQKELDSASASQMKPRAILKGHPSEFLDKDNLDRVRNDVARARAFIKPGFGTENEKLLVRQQLDIELARGLCALNNYPPNTEKDTFVLHRGKNSLSFYANVPSLNADEECARKKLLSGANGPLLEGTGEMEQYSTWNFDDLPKIIEEQKQRWPALKILDNQVLPGFESSILGPAERKINGIPDPLGYSHSHLNTHSNNQRTPGTDAQIGVEARRREAAKKTPFFPMYLHMGEVNKFIRSAHIAGMDNGKLSIGMPSEMLG